MTVTSPSSTDQPLMSLDLSILEVSGREQKRRLIECLEKLDGHFPNPHTSFQLGEQQLLSLASLARPTLAESHRRKTVDLLSLLWETQLHRTTTHDKKKQGAFYTPKHQVCRLVDLVEESFSERPLPHTIDPACGTGEFLLELIDRFKTQHPNRDSSEFLARIHGVDIDPFALCICALRIADRLDVTYPEAKARLRHGDAERLVANEPENYSERFDLVIGNPPFGSAISKRTGRTEEEREFHRVQFPNASTGAYDRAGVFVELGTQLCRRNGLQAWILPRALLAAPYAKRLRNYLCSEWHLSSLCSFPSQHDFRHADVFVFGVLLSGRQGQTAMTQTQVGAPGKPTTLVAPPNNSLWAPLLSPYQPLLEYYATLETRLNDVADIRACSTTAEAYAIAPLIEELAPLTQTGYFRFLTCGALDPLTNTWGERPQRYLGSTYLYPGIPKEAAPHTRREQWRQPGVLIGGLSKVLEAVPDSSGTYAGAVSVIKVTSEKLPLTGLSLWLNCLPARIWYLLHFAPLALSGGSVQVTRRKLAGIPIDRKAIEQLENIHLSSAYSAPVEDKQVPTLGYVDTILDADTPSKHPIQRANQLLAEGKYRPFYERLSQILRAQAPPTQSRR